jgi:hypothetical protein
VNQRRRRATAPGATHRRGSWKPINFQTLSIYCRKARKELADILHGGGWFDDPMDTVVNPKGNHEDTL